MHRKGLRMKYKYRNLNETNSKPNIERINYFFRSFKSTVFNYIWPLTSGNISKVLRGAFPTQRRYKCEYLQNQTCEWHEIFSVNLIDVPLYRYDLLIDRKDFFWNLSTNFWDIAVEFEAVAIKTLIFVNLIYLQQNSQDLLWKALKILF